MNFMCEILKAPFPWFGGKSRAANLIWPRFGNVPNYVEPFAGSLAVLLRRPHAPRNEIVNDLDCYVANAWRAMKFAPDEVSQFCDWPVNEADLHARHRWLHAQAEFRERMKNDPDYFDARVAGFWIWGVSCWIGGNFCQPKNQESSPHLSRNQGVNAPPDVSEQISRITGCSIQIPYLGGTGGGGKGVARQVPHLTGGQGGSAEGAASENKYPPGSQGIRPGYHGRCGVMANQQTENLLAWFDRIADRLRQTKVCCGDWTRVCTKAATFGVGLTGVLLDPPYDPAAGLDIVYGDHHSETVSAEVREWAIANGDNPLLRICLCGYDTEHEMPANWDCVQWKAAGGYASAAGNSENSSRERLWFSPHCLNPEPQLL